MRCCAGRHHAANTCRGAHGPVQVGGRRGRGSASAGAGHDRQHGDTEGTRRGPCQMRESSEIGPATHWIDCDHGNPLNRPTSTRSTTWRVLARQTGRDPLDAAGQAVDSRVCGYSTIDTRGQPSRSVNSPAAKHQITSRLPAK